MKKIVFGLSLLAVSLFAETKIFVSKSVVGAGDVGQEIFFGSLAEYQEAQAKVMKAVAAKGAEGALNAGLSGGAQALARGMGSEGLKFLSGGAVIGIIGNSIGNYIIDKYYSDQEFVLVKKVNGGLKAIYLVGDRCQVQSKTTPKCNINMHH